MYPQSMFEAKRKYQTHFFHLNIIVFTAMKNCSLLHRHVCVMILAPQNGLCLVWLKHVPHFIENLNEFHSGLVFG